VIRQHGSASGMTTDVIRSPALSPYWRSPGEANVGVADNDCHDRFESSVMSWNGRVVAERLENASAGGVV